VPKFEMVSTIIMVYEDPSIMKMDELSGYFLFVEESTSNEHMENDFSIRYQGQVLE